MAGSFCLSGSYVLLERLWAYCITFNDAELPRAAVEKRCELIPIMLETSGAIREHEHALQCYLCILWRVGDYYNRSNPQKTIALCDRGLAALSVYGKELSARS